MPHPARRMHAPAIMMMTMERGNIEMLYTTPAREFRRVYHATHELKLMQEESAFVALTERVLGAIGAALDAAESDVDWSENDGVLTIECGGGRIIVNRHVPNRELWVAARSGGFHFRPADGKWRDTRSGEELAAALRRLLQEHDVAGIDIPALPT